MLSRASSSSVLPTTRKPELLALDVGVAAGGGFLDERVIEDDVVRGGGTSVGGDEEQPGRSRRVEAGGNEAPVVRDLELGEIGGGAGDIGGIGSAGGVDGGDAVVAGGARGSPVSE